MRQLLRGLSASGLALVGLIYCSTLKLITFNFERDDGLQGLSREQRKSTRKRRKQMRQEQEKI